MNLRKLYKECRRRTKYWNKLQCADRVHDLTGENRYILAWDIFWCNIIYGTFDEDYIRFRFYRKNRRERKRWLTGCLNYYWLMDRLYDERAIRTFDDKTEFDAAFQTFMHHEVLVCAEASEEEVRAFITRHGEVIVKPATGALGIGVYKLKSSDAEGINALLQHISAGESLIIEEVIRQHADMARLNPTSVNTIRVITMLDRDGQPHILNTVAMLGADEGCVSNTHSGGCLCHIDTKTGVIDHLGTNVEGAEMLRHPVTGVVLPGYQIPNWEGLTDYVSQLARVVPSARYIGWDIVILPEGYDVIEGNIHPGPGHQATNDVGCYDAIKALL